MEENQEKSSGAPSRLPWLVLVGALLVYLVTLNHWVSLTSLPVVSTFTNPARIIPVTGPLQYLITYPFHALPSAIQVTALNLFSAVCAALTLALLARCVSLLPQDRTREQRHREFSEHSLLSLPTAWIPPVFAVLICGLQISFWEHATAATGEMLSLLLFAYSVRCVLEYRISEQQSWLLRLAFVYGLATTSNWAMIGFFPAFVVALVWMKGREFFRLSFLLRMLAWGAAGLILYLVLPLLTVFDDRTNLSFLEALRLNLVAQKATLLAMPRVDVFIAALTSLLPVLIIGIRWPSSFGDTSAVGNMLTGFVFKVVHGILLAAILLTMFDGPFSPRSLMERRLEGIPGGASSLPFLTFYFLAALSAGYFVAYYLLIFSRSEQHGRHRQKDNSVVINRLLSGVVYIVVIMAPLGLAYKNLPGMRVNNGTLFRDYARVTSHGLPEKNAIALADDSRILTLVQTWLNESKSATNNLLVNTRLMPYPAYQRLLHETRPDLWPSIEFAEDFSGVFNPGFMAYQVGDLSRSNSLYYLHPSFGYFFEYSYLEPEGPVYRVKSYPPGEVNPPRIEPLRLQQNSDFWAARWSELEELVSLVQQGYSDAQIVGRWYSIELNAWGVALQQHDQTDAATRFFEFAARLNPGNVLAEANLAVNQALLQGDNPETGAVKSVADHFGAKFRTWNALLALNGPVDEPGLLLALGQEQLRQSLFRQASHAFTRAVELDPKNPTSRLMLANTYLSSGAYQQALQVVEAVETDIPPGQLPPAQQIALIRVKALVYHGQGETQKAEDVLLEAMKSDPYREAISETLAELYTATDRLDEALSLVNRQLESTPGSLGLMVAKAVVLMRLEQYDEAQKVLDLALERGPDDPETLLTQAALFIQRQQYAGALPHLDLLLKLQPGNRAARMNRAIALLQGKDLEGAEQDYRLLLRDFPRLHTIRYGLGEIAYRRKDYPTAIAQYQAYLQLAPTNTDEARQVTVRLAELSAEQP